MPREHAFITGMRTGSDMMSKALERDLRKKQMADVDKQRKVENRMRRKKLEMDKKSEKLARKVNEERLSALKQGRWDALEAKRLSTKVQAEQKHSRIAAMEAAMEFDRTISSLGAGDMTPEKLDKVEAAYRRYYPVVSADNKLAGMMEGSMERAMKRMEGYRRGLGAIQQQRAQVTTRTDDGSVNEQIPTPNVSQFQRLNRRLQDSKDEFENARAAKDSGASDRATRAQRSISTLERAIQRLRTGENLRAPAANPAAPQAAQPAAPVRQVDPNDPLSVLN